MPVGEPCSPDVRANTMSWLAWCSPEDSDPDTERGSAIAVSAASITPPVEDRIDWK